MLIRQDLRIIARGHFITVLSVRPKVAELVFQLYGRVLHPELFQVFKTQEVERGDYSAKVQITSAGHVVTWRHQGITLSEVATSAQHPLPQRRRPLQPQTAPTLSTPPTQPHPLKNYIIPPSDPG